jgi:hypothetical protein
MQQRKIILFFIILFIASSFWLFYQSDKQRDPNSGGDWWAAYFVDPKGDSLNFSIENHSDKINFHWEIFADQDKIAEASTEAPKGTTKDINLSNIDTKNFANKKISVRISADDEVREIYKNL